MPPLLDLHTQAQHTLPVAREQVTGLLEQQPQLGPITRRADMPHDPTTPPTDSAICTAVAPEPVCTFRPHATSPACRPD